MKKAREVTKQINDDNGYACAEKIASALRDAARVPEGCVRIGDKDYKDERMYWDPGAPEDVIEDPYDIVDSRDLIEGNTFRLWVAVRLPSQVFTTTLADDKYGYREATPEEVAAHEADEAAARERRKAHFAELNRLQAEKDREAWEKRKAAAPARLAELERQDTFTPTQPSPTLVSPPTAPPTTEAQRDSSNPGTS